MFKQCIGIALFGLLLISCDEEPNQGPNFVDPNPDDVEIRINNEARTTLDSIYLNTSGGEQDYSVLLWTRKSSYKSFEFAYQIFHLRFKAYDKKFEYRPQDYSGESKVDAGKYTLSIKDLDSNNLTFTYRLERD